MNATADALVILVTATQAVATVPLDAVHTLAVAEVKPRRYWTYVGSAGLAGVLVTVQSNRLVPGVVWLGVALGAAAALTILLAGWVIPTLRRWLVGWRLIYRA